MKQQRNYQRNEQRRSIDKRILIMGLSLFILSLSILFFGLGSNQAQARPEKQEYLYQTVVVAAGDTLWDLAVKYAPEYTDTREFAQKIRQINGILREDRLQPGQYLVIPYYP